ncbi:MAG: type II toxin-antitoxin system HicB family antitoxin [Halobacteriovoraceae bacterium]|nr:type II toxin-antitoxin system HicB family antitoxin [Halobacteriovoraceae bacterium]
MKFEGKLIKNKGDKYWGVEVPEIGIFTQGKTKKDAYKMIKEAIELVVNLDNFEVKIEPGNNGVFFIIPNNIGPILALILKQKRIDNGLTVRDVAMRLGQMSPNSYGRYESGKSIPTLEKFDELLTAINPNSSSILKVS